MFFGRFAVFQIHPKMANDPKKDKKSIKGPTPEDIVNGFNTLRSEQRSLATKLSEFEMDLNEHK